MSNHTYKEVQQTMKFLKFGGIIALMVAIGILGVVGGYTVSTRVLAQQLVICGSNATEEDSGPAGDQGCYPGPTPEEISQAPFAGWDPSLDNIIVIGPNPVDVDGNAGDDQIYNTASTGDTTDCASGQQLVGGAGNDLIVDNDFANTLDGDADNDALFGNGGPDCLNGGDGDDFLSGGAGDDFLDGGDGNDVIIGGPGDDTYADETGNDIYIFFSGDATAGTEEINIRCDGTYIFVGFGTTVFPTEEGDHAVTDANGGRYVYTIPNGGCPNDNPAKIVGM